MTGNTYAPEEYGKTVLKIPSQYFPTFKSLVKNQQKNGSYTNHPFKEHIDLWFFCVCYGAYRNNAVPSHNPQELTKGGTLSSKPGLIEALEILVISKNQTPDCINNPAEIISEANEYAAGGLQLGILDLLKQDGLPIQNLYDQILGIMKDQQKQFI